MRPNEETNLAKAQRAWGEDMPGWVRFLAEQSDKNGQRGVAEQLGKSNPYVSRLINRTYTGSYGEAEQQVLALEGKTTVPCPAWGSDIPLSSCMFNRRRKPPAINLLQKQFAKFCPSCRFNPDIDQEDWDDQP